MCFLHEESEVCKYDILCERKDCMFRHEEVEDIIDDDKDDPHISDIEDEENCDSENDSEESQDVNEKVECVEGKDATNVLMLNMRRQT